MDWRDCWSELRGQGLRLTPSVPEDAAELSETVGPDTFQHSLGSPDLSSPEAFASFVHSGTSTPYTMRLESSSEVVGCSSFMDQREAHRSVEIGATWIAPNWRGTFVNPAAKLLMLRHGFEVLDCVRVQLKCDARNTRSSRAILKLGAKFEGCLRAYGVMPDGYVRDTLMYSILPTEWPEVRDRLETRLVGLT